MSLSNQVGPHLRHSVIPQVLRTCQPSPPTISTSVVDDAHEARERLLDDTLAASFPASDPLPWTLGRRGTAPPER